MCGFPIILISETGGRIVLQWTWEWLCGRELSGSGCLYWLWSVLWQLWVVELQVMSNTQVNSFQHQISCSVPYLRSVCLLLVVPKRHLVLSFLLKRFNDTFSFLLTFIDGIILIIFACLRIVNVIFYFRSSNKYAFCYRHISSGPYQEY